MSRLKTLAELVRLPNVFSAIADVLLGFFLAAAFVESAPWAALPLAIIASISLYWSGMVLNDFFDADADAAQRPTRPIPSGRISRGNVWRLGFGLLIFGVAVAWLATPVANSARPGLIAICVATCVLCYDGGLKRTPIGPLAMGACRLFNVLLGAALVTTSEHPWFPLAVWCAASGVATYVVGVTLFARKEAETSPRLQLVFALLIMLTGLGLIAAIPVTTGFQDFPIPYWWLAVAGFGVLIGWRVWPALRDPSPARVQPTVGGLLRLLIFLDALAICTANTAVAIVMLSLIPLAALCGRWAYST
ncbi:MAG: UbiA family prenyltransferase [Pirellulales bacterium]|nr:UbiA family prenyltransferase [Pirellulales bacterium]